MATTGKTALVVGATGLVGGELVKLLLDDGRYARVLAFTRRPLGREHEKLVVNEVDFRDLASFGDRLRGDVLFSALGSTKQKAGTRDARYEVDHTFQHTVAARAAENGVPVYALVSATGAKASSSSFYLRMRGELERDVMKLPFARIRILRPGFLAGERPESRPGEAAAIAVLRVASRLPGLGAFRPIPAETVARALLAAARDETPGIKVYSAGELFALGQS